MKRMVIAALALSMTTLGVRAEAQRPSFEQQQQAYKERRAELMEQLEQTNEQLAEIRQLRLQLETRIENIIAQMMQERAQALLLSSEQDALRELDAILTSAQDNLLAQRDRFVDLGAAVRGRAGAVLVVMLRTDSMAAPGLAQATLEVNGVAAEQRDYSPTARTALGMGAVDEIYRADVLPTAHTVTLRTTVNGQPVTETLRVDAPRESITYVEFVLRDGRLVPRTWTSQGTTPF